MAFGDIMNPMMMDPAQFGTIKPPSNIPPANPARTFGPMIEEMRLQRQARMDQYNQGRQASGGGRMAGMMGGLLGGNQDMNAYNDPAFHEQANKLLANYGLSLPQSVGPNAILPNSGFFGNHPRLSGGIEGAMLGFMNTPETTGGTGQGITNALRGALGGMAEKRQLLAQRMMQPFAQAGQLEQMQQMIDRHQASISEEALRQAHIKYYDAEAEHLTQDNKNQYYGERVGEDGKLYGINKRTNKLEVIPGSEDSPFVSKAEPGIASSIPLIHELGLDPNNMSQSDWHKVNLLKQQREVQVSGAKAGADTAARETERKKQGYLSDKERSDLKDIEDAHNKQLLNPNNAEARRNFVYGGGNREDWTKFVEQHNNKVEQSRKQAKEDFYAGQNPMGGTSQAPQQASPTPALTPTKPKKQSSSPQPQGDVGGIKINRDANGRIIGIE